MKKTQESIVEISKRTLSIRGYREGFPLTTIPTGSLKRAEGQFNHDDARVKLQAQEKEGRERKK